MLLVFNKTDRLKDSEVRSRMKRSYPSAVFVSCHKGTGLKALRKAIIDHYEKNLLPYKVKLDYEKSGLIPEIRKHALVVKERYAAKWMTLDLRIWPHHKSKLMELLNGRS